MNQKAIVFVQNQLARADSRIKPLLQSSDGTTYPKRYAYFRLDKLIKNFATNTSEDRWVVMPGISGVGKTTILAQLYNDYVDSFSLNHILFISLDNAALLGISLQEILDAYENILGKAYEELEQPLLILIDEAHRDPSWSSSLKVLWGRTKKAFFICTGSSAVLLAPHFEDLGRRLTVEKLYPLCFTEYEMIKRGIKPEKGLKQQINKSVYEGSNATQVYQDLSKLQATVNNKWASYPRLDIKEYLSIGTMPFTLQNPDEARAFLAVERIIDKLVQKDILELGDFKKDTIQQIKPLLMYIAEGSILSVSKVGGELGLTKKPLQDVLDVLVEAEVLIKVAPFKAENKPYKYLFMCPAIRNSLLDISGLKATQATRGGDILEDVVALHLYREFVATGKGKITYDPAQGGADFILDLRIGRRIVIEVGVGDKRISQAQQTLEKTKADYAIILSSDPVSLHGNVVKVPHDYFFLM